MPEGIVLEVPEVGTFVPIVSDQPGVPPFGLTLLGHERLDTVRIYTRPSEADLEKAVRKGAGELL